EQGALVGEQRQLVAVAVVAPFHGGGQWPQVAQRRGGGAEPLRLGPGAGQQLLRQGRGVGLCPQQSQVGPGGQARQLALGQQGLGKGRVAVPCQLLDQGVIAQVALQNHG